VGDAMRRRLVVLCSQWRWWRCFLCVCVCVCVCADDFQACASNLQALVSTLAVALGLPEDMQQGLNAREQALFDAQLAALHEVRLLLRALCACRGPHCSAGRGERALAACLLLRRSPAGHAAVGQRRALRGSGCGHGRPPGRRAGSARSSTG
jgi:hypothetical protein